MSGMNDVTKPSLGFMMVDAARLLRRRFEQESRDIAMTGAQLQIVARLTKNEGIGQAALAALLELEPMTLCRHVDRMVAAGLVERRQDPVDRRARQLFTTPKSRTLIAPMRERVEVVIDQAQAGLSPEQRAALLESLGVMIKNLSAADPAGAAQTSGDAAASEAKNTSSRMPVRSGTQRAPVGEVA